MTTTAPALTTGTGKRIHISAVAHGWTVLDTMTVAGNTVASYKCNDIVLAVHVAPNGCHVYTQVFRETPNALYQINLLNGGAEVEDIMIILDIIEEQAVDRSAR